MELFHCDIETVGQYKDFESFELDDIRGSELFKKKFHKMNWETKYQSYSEAYLEQAGIISTYGKIVCISFGYINNDGVSMISSYYGDDEKDIVNKFNILLKKIETKNFNLCGFRILYFDLPYLLHKMHKYGIEPANILYLYDKKPWEMRVVDISDDWRSKFAWAFSLDEVAYELSVKSPKDAMDGSQVHQYFWDGRIEEIKTYCDKDVSVTIEISKVMYR